MTTEKRRAISSKYLDDDDMNRKDEERLRLLRRQERLVVSVKPNRIKERQGLRSLTVCAHREYQYKRDKLEEAKSCLNRCWAAFRPFKFLIGILFLLVRCAREISVLTHPLTF